ncbi:VanZ family protein [Emticicia oligotrophica]|uniref:VanZ family protein n=1 Tax=Emticicia oligotrophica TaxID=312279 RepID=UPI00273A8683|nr:VanZ family protein [Emticicia oligotrophica]
MKKRLLSISVFIIYCAILIKVMVFKDMPTIQIGQLMLNFSGTNAGHGPNFVPFKTILPYLLGHKGLIIAGINLIGNIALLVPIGFLVPFINQKLNWKIILFIAIVAGLSIELPQVALGVGIFDIDDILLNALGVMVGYWAFLIFARWLRSKNYKAIIAVTTIIIIVSASALYAIYPKDQPLMNDRNIVKNINSDNKTEISQGNDPCNGTGGTGQIIEVANNSINIRRNDGVVQTIKFTNGTTIKNSMGAVTKADLKIGNRVTLVIDESETASFILVCNSR